MDSATTEQLKKEVMDALKRGNPAEAFDKVQKCLDDLDDTPLNIAITGESGSGKSTFINAIRGIGDEDPSSAKTGVVETTMVPTPYSHPKYKSVIFWDLPGLGSPNFKAKEYLDKVDFQHYDFFVIMASERFKENHIMLAESIQCMNKQFYFVRSKVDRDVNESRMRRPKYFNENTLLDTISQDCVNSLKTAGTIDPYVFLVSSFQPQDFDFSLLLKTFEEQLPTHKRYVYLRALPNISSEAIAMKVQALTTAVPLIALKVAIASIVPGYVQYSECSTLTSYIREYVESFGLDDNSLDDLAQRSHKSLIHLKSLVKSPFVKYEITYDLVWKELRKRNSTDFTTAKTIISWVPVLSVFAGAMSAMTCAAFLFSAMNELAEDAKTVLEVAFGCSDHTWLG
ncbi:interferon-inducible GTPase 5-like [Aquarana catesbeiana]|uniref:interferon-inducible GTPase 5-like n=1 Tax=Aquarana catesbeiana TaxID=8400 RepID=UPI003CCA5084